MITGADLEQFILIRALDKIVEADKVNRQKNPYNNLILINGKNPESTLNKILSCPTDVYQFWSNLTDLQKSFLVPKIELFYKTYKNKKEVYEPVMFRTYPDFEQARAFAINEIDEFNLESNPREDGSGIKSITINDKAEKPSDVNIEAKLELFFDNELALYNSNLLQLIRTKELRTYGQSVDFRLKLVCGWNVPVDASETVFSKKDLEIIERSNRVYLLELVTHNINFNENGSINMIVEYQGALEKYLSISPEMDIFNLTDSDKLRLLKGELSIYKQTVTYVDSSVGTNGEEVAGITSYGTVTEKTIQEDPNKYKYIQLSIERISLELQISALYKQEKNDEEQSKEQQEQIDTSLQTLQTKLDEIKKQISDIEMYVVTEKYNRILNQIMASNGLSYIELNQSFFDTLASQQIQSNKNLLEGLLSGLTPFLQPKLLNNNVPIFQKAEVIDQMLNMEKVMKQLSQDVIDDEERLEIAEKFVEEYNEAVKERDYDKIKEKKEELIKLIDAKKNGSTEDRQKKLETDLNGKKFIHYTTLGDIINAAASLVKIEDGVDFVIGPCKVGNYIINLSEFPISLKAFQIWFINNVIKKSKRTYFIWEFIQDIFKNLVTPNLISSKILDKESLNINVQITSIVTDTKLQRGKIYNDTDQNVLNALSPAAFNFQKMNLYLVIYIYDYKMEKRKGDFAEDYKDGIYHHFRSNNVGIIKQIAFSKIDFPRYRDMRITNNKFNDTGDILREHYNATIIAIGSPLFTIGGHIFLNASSIGKYGRKIASSLGLSGYYLVTGIEHTFSPENGYESKIDCTWTFPESKQVETQRIFRKEES